MTRVNVADLETGMSLKKAPFMLATVEEALDRNANAYLKLTLRDKSGDVQGRYWRVPKGVADRLAVGNGVSVSGHVEDYKGALQVIVQSISACELEDWSAYMPTARRPQSELVEELQRLISSVKNPWLKQLLKETLGDSTFQEAFFLAPAAKSYHHACVGGLLEHSLDVARQVVTVARRYPELDRDLGATVALLHDVGKVDSYEREASFEFTDAGNLLGHIYMGAARVDAAIGRIEGFPEELRLRIVHAILAHHGEKEKGSPVLPRTPEAIAVHYADNLDGSLRGWVDHVSRERTVDTAWSSYSKMHHDVRLFVGADDEWRAS
jgi:3'-5' exoribonuclease